jgi:hypothetical protein
MCTFFAEFLQVALYPFATPPLEEAAPLPVDEVRAAIARFRVSVAQLRQTRAKLVKPLRIASGLLQRTVGRRLNDKMRLPHAMIHSTASPSLMSATVVSSTHSPNLLGG